MPCLRTQAVDGRWRGSLHVVLLLPISERQVKMPKYTVEEWTNEGAQEHYWENCPDECVGHYEDKDRLFSVTNIFDRHDGDGAGYFSKTRANLLAAFMEVQDDQD